MSFTGKLNAGMSSFARSMKNGADNYKLDGKIAEQEKRRGVSYALVANTTSFAIGLWLAHLIPGIF